MGQDRAQGTSLKQPQRATEIPKHLSEQDAFEPEDDDDDYDPTAAGREAAEALRDCYG